MCSKVGRETPINAQGRENERRNIGGASCSVLTQIQESRIPVTSDKNEIVFYHETVNIRACSLTHGSTPSSYTHSTPYPHTKLSDGQKHRTCAASNTKSLVLVPMYDIKPAKRYVPRKLPLHNRGSNTLRFCLRVSHEAGTFRPGTAPLGKSATPRPSIFAPAKGNGAESPRAIDLQLKITIEISW